MRIILNKSAINKNSCLELLDLLTDGEDADLANDEGKIAKADPKDYKKMILNFMEETKMSTNDLNEEIEIC